MRYKPHIDPRHIYAAKRVGDLVDYANPLTFSLLQKIYGPNGPYRNELARFGLSNPIYPKNHLTNIYGRIYSDLTIENYAIWYPAGYELVVKDDTVTLHHRIFNPLFPQDLVGLFKKVTQDISIQLNPKRLNFELNSRYTQFSKLSRAAILNHHLTLEQFLDLYHHVTFISFIHQMLSSIYDHKGKLTNNQEVQKYLNQNDYTINTNEKKYEHEFTRLGFELGHHQIIHPESSDFIPDELPFPSNLSYPTALLTKTKAMQSNMRLKIYPMVYELNAQLREIAKIHNLSRFSFLTMDELLSIDGSVDVYNLIIDEREEYYDTGKQMKLPDIIKDGKIEKLTLPETELTNYQGIGCSAGKVIGILGEITDPNQAVVADINIFPNASPDFTPQFKQSKGIIFQSGSPLAHGAILARELKIPAVILDTDFRPLIGKQITMDGTEGTITIVNTY